MRQITVSGKKRDRRFERQLQRQTNVCRCCSVCNLFADRDGVEALPTASVDWQHPMIDREVTIPLLEMRSWAIVGALVQYLRSRFLIRLNCP